MFKMNGKSKIRLVRICRGSKFLSSTVFQTIGMLHRRLVSVKCTLSMDLIKLIEYAHNMPCTIAAGHGFREKITTTRECSLHVYKRAGMCVCVLRRENRFRQSGSWINDIVKKEHRQANRQPAHGWAMHSYAYAKFSTLPIEMFRRPFWHKF